MRADVADAAVNELEQGSEEDEPPTLRYRRRAASLKAKRSIHILRLSKRELEARRREARELEQLIPVEHLTRPRTRAECIEGSRPCPWVSCRYHLFVEVSQRGNITMPFADREPDEIPETCTLDLASRGGMNREDIALMFGVTREAIRKMEIKALTRLAERMGVPPGRLAMLDATGSERDDEEDGDEQADEEKDA